MTKFALVFILFIILGLASGSKYFVVKEVSPIVLYPNSQANFTITIKNIGDEGDYAKPIFRNISEGIEITDASGNEYFFPMWWMASNATIAAGDIAPGNYSIEIGAFGRGSPVNYREIPFEVRAAPSAAIPAEASVVPIQQPVAEPEDIEAGHANLRSL